MDISSALKGATSGRNTGACKLQLILDEIPADEPGRDDLMAAVEDRVGFPARRLAQAFSALDKPVSRTVIDDHRNRVCRCHL